MHLPHLPHQLVCPKKMGGILGKKTNTDIKNAIRQGLLEVKYGSVFGLGLPGNTLETSTYKILVQKDFQDSFQAVFSKSCSGVDIIEGSTGLVGWCFSDSLNGY